MIGRISAQSTTTQFQQLNASAEAKVAKYNRQIATGHLFDNPSESPSDTSLLLGNERRLARIEQFSRNASSANQWLASTDQALQSTNDSIVRARTLTVQGLNSGSGSDSSLAAAKEIRQIRDQLIGTANTTQGGRSIFSGTAPAPAYDSAGLYQGDSGSVSRSIDTYEVIGINSTGPEVFGESNPTDPMNGSIFEKLSAIADALEAGDNTTASQGLDAIDDALDLVRTELGKVGASVNRIDMAQVRLADEQFSTQNRISDTRDADLAEAIMGLRAAETGYEALMSTTARSMSTSMLDFMR